MSTFFRYFLMLITLLMWLQNHATAGIVVDEKNRFENAVNINRHIAVFEDSTYLFSPQDLINNDSIFEPLPSFIPQNPRGTYWLKFNINKTGANHVHLRFFYQNFTYVDLYEYRDHKLYKKHHAGLFRPKSQITPGDDFDNINLSLSPGDQTSVLIKIRHVKGYKPQFDFFLQNDNSFHARQMNTHHIDFLIFGGFIFFLFYALINFFVTWYKPYLWLALLIFGLSFYGFSMAGHVIYFFHEIPETVWRLNPVFANISGVGGFMLIGTYFNLKNNSKPLSIVLYCMIGLLLLQIIAGQLILHYSLNYKLMTNLNLFTLLLYIPILIATPMVVWKKLSKHQRLLSWVIYIYSAVLLFAFFILWFQKEGATSNIVWIANLIGLIVIIFFTISLGEQLRGIEVERNQALEQLSRIKEEQNKILEELVEKRTNELTETNKELEDQRDALAKRNERIELLLKELHHRVKNNLQLFSSFYELSAYSPEGKELKNIVEEGQSRIRVMALVHEMLYHGNQANTINIEQYLSKISIYIQSFLKNEKEAKISVKCGGLFFDLDTALPLGLMVNELMTNTFKHCNPEAEKIIVEITIEPGQNNAYILTFTDNGKIIEKDINQAGYQNFGMKMISLLSKQLNGNFRYVYEQKNRFIIEFNDVETLKQIP
ncbi:MAG: hypothetical protein K9H26_12400 [Prolixibacteraceae bacterium]|nr:hypothetical protein [Prolixibacteraceae bacterium]